MTLPLPSPKPSPIRSWSYLQAGPGRAPLDPKGSGWPADPARKGNTLPRPCLGCSPSRRGLQSWARLDWKPSIPFAQFPSPLGLLLPGSWYWQHQARGQAGCPLRGGGRQDYSLSPPFSILFPLVGLPFSILFPFPLLHLRSPRLLPSLRLFTSEKTPELKAAGGAGMPGTHTHTLPCVVAV